MRRKPHSEETKKKIGLANSIALKGRKVSPGVIEKIRIAMIGNKNGLGKPAWNKGLRGYGGGEKHWNWQGGKTVFIQKLRNSLEYKLWRTAVFQRDSYTCIWCGDSRGGNLNADHIKPFADYPELRFAIDNGRTLCIDCHKTTDTYGNHKEH